jgi:hypothetical protein
MGEDRTQGLRQLDSPEPHAAALSRKRPSVRRRSAPTISAMTDTAISAGLAAPMSSPMGA